MAAYPEVDAVVSFRLFMSLNSDEEHGGAAAEAAAPSTAPPAHRDRAAAVPRTPSMPRPALQDSPRRDPGGADEFLLSKVARSRVVIGGGDEDDDRNDGERLREYTVASVWSNSSCPKLHSTLAEQKIAMVSNVSLQALQEKLTSFLQKTRRARRHEAQFTACALGGGAQHQDLLEAQREYALRCRLSSA